MNIPNKILATLIISSYCYIISVWAEGTQQQKTEQYIAQQNGKLLNKNCRQNNTFSCCDHNLTTTDWYEKSLLPESIKAKLPDFICGAYIEPQSYLTMNKDDSILLTASETTIDNKYKANAVGNVKLSYKQHYIECDNITIEQPDNTYSFKGNIKLRNPGVLITGSSGYIVMNNKAKLTNSDFILYSMNSHGHADEVLVDNKGILQLNDAYYTSCPPSKELWRISGKKIILDKHEKVVRITHARLELHHLPIFWLPYLAFSTDDNKKVSGFLAPEFGFASSYKLNIAIPFYLNISPDYDLVLTFRYLQKQGKLAETDFSYNNNWFNFKNQGSFKTNFFLSPNHDQTINNKNKTDYYIDWQNSSSYKSNFTLAINYKKVSNLQYFTNINFSSIEKKYLKQNILANWNNAINNNLTLAVKCEIYNIQKLAENYVAPYNKKPNIIINSNWKLTEKLQLNTAIDYSQFTNNNSDLTQNINPSAFLELLNINGKRLFTNLTANYHETLGNVFFQPEVGVANLNYDLEITNRDKSIADLSRAYSQFKASDYSSTPRISVAYFNITAGIKTNKSVKFANTKWDNLFEPKLKYSFCPYAGNQIMQPIFDTDEISITSYDLLWQANRFSGKDRLADYNQLTLGFSSKLTNENNTITAGFNLGQTIYFSNRQVWINPKINLLNHSNLVHIDLDHEQLRKRQQLTSHISPLVVGTQLEIKQKLKLNNTLCWDLENHELNYLKLELDYFFTAKYFIKLVYRHQKRGNRFIFDSNNDIITLKNGNLKTANNNLNDIGIAFYYPVNPKVNIISGLQHNLTLADTTDILAGIEYSNCCYQFKLLWNRWLDRSENYDFPAERYRVLFQFTIYGLNSTKNSNNHMLSRLANYTDFEN